MLWKFKGFFLMIIKLFKCQIIGQLSTFLYNILTFNKHGIYSIYQLCKFQLSCVRPLTDPGFEKWAVLRGEIKNPAQWPGLISSTAFCLTRITGESPE